VINGDLTVTATDIDDLAGMGSLQRVDGALSIEGSVASLTGLENLEAVGAFSINGTTVLLNLDALESLSGATSLSLQGNTTLADATLSLVGEMTALTLSSNAALEQLQLAGVTAITGSWQMQGNNVLTSIDVGSLASIGTWQVQGNALLSDLGNLDTLTSVDEMAFNGNASLSQCTIDALETRLMACTSCVGGNLACP
jgi:hypothetical protein